MMIYLLEDEDNIRELVVYTLRNTGFDTAGFSNSLDFWKEIADRTPHLILLDIMLPGEDGLTVLKRLRANPLTAKLPVIMLTAKGEEYDKVLGLDLGADDYMPKPFGMMELVARVKSLLRRTETGALPDEYRIGGLFASIPRHIVSAGGAEIKLTLKEFELLVFLMKNAGIVLTRDRILTAIWGYDFDGETRTVDVHIRTLRSKLGECGGMIRTVRGVGYKIGENE
jgi:two-component system alkaline phosphatase synthesis response regulator PhoP